MLFCQKSGHQKKDCTKYKNWKTKKEKENKSLGSDKKANICMMAKGEDEESNKVHTQSSAPCRCVPTSSLRFHAYVC